jgi:hypothetical protein
VQAEGEGQEVGSSRRGLRRGKIRKAHKKNDLQDGSGLGEVRPKFIFKRGARRLVTILCGVPHGRVAATVK